MSDTVKPSALRVWPVYVALGMVGMLIVGDIVFDVRLEQRVSADVDSIVGKSQRSIVLLDTIRARAEDLHRPSLSETERSKMSLQIAALARDYEPLVNDGERSEWNHLEDLIRGLSLAPLGDDLKRSLLAKQANESVDRLMAVNVDKATRNAARIRDAHRDVIRDSILSGALTIVIVGIISLVLLRVLARQRRLVAAHMQTLADKNRDLEAFAGRAAHDLRSPMNPIRGYADLILEAKGAPEDVTRMAKRIRTSVDRMARVVDDMLALSTAGRPIPGTSSTEEVVALVLEELGPDLHEVEVTTRLSAGRVAASAGIVNQLLRNLIGNAVKFRARTRPLHIAIETRDVGGMAEIVVEDNGVGMDSETAAHAFEPQFRGRTDREVPGHGLGLAIIERTTTALGGACELSSVADQGTRITVRLPRA
jgi:signal transduction histidine kinase